MLLITDLCYSNTLVPKRFKLRTVCGDANFPYFFRPKGLFYYSGDIYVANTGQHTIIKCNPTNGVINIVAGTSSTSGFTDNVAPLQAALNSPSDVWVVQDGVYYIADTFNRRIRVVSSGIMTTFVGDGNAASSPDNITPTQLYDPRKLYLVGNSMYYAEYAKVRSVQNLLQPSSIVSVAGSSYGSNIGAYALSSQIKAPQGLHFYSDSKYLIADTDNHRILKVENNIMTVIAGSNSQGYSTGNAIGSQLSSPSGVVAYGNTVIFTDTGNHCIRRINTDGTLSTIAGVCTTSGYNGDQPGDATNVWLASPSGIFEVSGDLFITDSVNGIIRKLEGYCDSGYTSYDNYQCVSTSAEPQCFGINASSATVCSGRGTCTSTDTCSCNTGYYGPQCNYTFICGGLIPDASTVCNSRGICQSQDMCQCNSGYVGNLCSTEANCFGTYSSASTVCGGKGVCVKNDKCTCNYGFYGVQCLYSYTCNGTAPDSSTVCNGRGTCNSNGICTCNSGYGGNYCEQTIMCYGFSAFDPSVCGASGVCTSSNVCSCNSGYYGTKCTYSYTCNGIAPDSPTVCNGRGTCNSNYACSCSSGYQGQYCELSQTTPTPTPTTPTTNTTIITTQGFGTTNIIIVSVVCGVAGISIILAIVIISIIIGLKLKKKKKSETTINNEMKVQSIKQLKDEQGFTKIEQSVKIQEEKAQDTFSVTITSNNSNSEQVNVFAANNGSSSQLPTSSVSNSTTNNSQLQSNNTTMGSYTNYLNNQQDESYTAFLKQDQDNSFKPPPTVVTQTNMDTFSSKDHTYKIIKVLGRGGFGVCYLCADIQSNDLIAVKAIPTNLGDFASIFSEFSKCLSFQHPNLVRSFEYLQGNGMMCLAMKYYKCGDLDYIFKNVAKRKPPSDELLISIINQVGEGLDYLHRTQKVLHRDIKPNNIMVDEFDEDNSKISLAIGDFGVSKQANNAHTFTGTLYYVSPELYAGSKETSYPTDIFSFVTMYLIICNKFNNMRQGITQLSITEGYDTVMEKVQKELKESGTRDDIIEIIMRMLSRDPLQRPLAEELGHFCKINVC